MVWVGANRRCWMSDSREGHGSVAGGDTVDRWGLTEHFEAAHPDELAGEDAEGHGVAHGGAPEQPPCGLTLQIARRQLGAARQIPDDLQGSSGDDGGGHTGWYATPERVVLPQLHGDTACSRTDELLPPRWGRQSR